MSKTTKVHYRLIEQAQAATTTVYFDIGNASTFAIQKDHGSVTGSFVVEERLGRDAADTTFDYVTNTNISITAPADDVHNEVLHYSNAAAQFYKVTYTHTSGTGDMNLGVTVFTRS